MRMIPSSGTLCTTNRMELLAIAWCSMHFPSICCDPHTPRMCRQDISRSEGALHHGPRIARGTRGERDRRVSCTIGQGDDRCAALFAKVVEAILGIAPRAVSSWLICGRKRHAVWRGQNGHGCRWRFVSRDDIESATVDLLAEHFVGILADELVPVACMRIRRGHRGRGHRPASNSSSFPGERSV